MNIVGKLVWRAQAVMGQVEARVQQNMDRAAIYLVNDVVRSFGNPPPEPDFKRGGYKKNSDRAWKEAHRSSPGDPPYVQTGMLRRSITFNKPDKLTRLVGSTLKPQGSTGSYALCLEYGTKKMRARPYLRPALARCKATLFRIISGH
jgi:hypothetical protein